MIRSWITREDAWAHSARHLTGAELDRLLHRYDLSEAVREALLQHEADNASWAWECYAEELAECGRATRRWTCLERYHMANPVHIFPLPAEPPAREWPEDEVPF